MIFRLACGCYTPQFTNSSFGSFTTSSTQPPTVTSVDRAEVEICTQRGQVLYDHWLPAIRNPVPIHDTHFDWDQWLQTPSQHFARQCQRLFDRRGREINIWNPDKPQILSALYNLPAVQRAFITHPEFDMSDSIPGFQMEVPPDTLVHTYWLANLQHHGNFQSDGALHMMLPYITSINARINPGHKALRKSRLPRSSLGRCKDMRPLLT